MLSKFTDRRILFAEAVSRGEKVRPSVQSATEPKHRVEAETANVWRALQARFRALPDPDRTLWAAQSDLGTWIVWGGPHDHVARASLQKNFRALANEAAVAAHLAGRGSPVDAWLNYLKRGPFYRSGLSELVAFENPARGYGRIEALCIASAECCLTLEATGLEQHLRAVLPSVNYKTPLALNLDRLRTECGWSFNRLSAASGIDKKSILRHIHAGGRALPQTIQAYAEAFSRQLRRSVTAEQLLR